MSNEKIRIQFQIYAQIVPTPNSDIHERVSFECTLEQSEFLVDNIDVFAMPLNVIMRKQTRAGRSVSNSNVSADRDQTDSEYDTTSTGDNEVIQFRFSPISRNRRNSTKGTTRVERDVQKSVSYVPLTKNFAKLDLPTAGSYDGLNEPSHNAMSRLTNVCVGVSDLSNLCYPTCDTQDASYHVMRPYMSDKGIESRNNSMVVNWAQDQKPLADQPPQRPAKFVVAINLNNLKKSSTVDEAVQTDNSEATQTVAPMREFQNIFDESIVKDTLELYEQQLQPLKQFVRTLKEKLKALSIEMDNGVATPRDQKSETTTPRHSAGEESCLDDLERESRSYPGKDDDDDNVQDKPKHLREAGELTAEKVWDFINNQGDWSEDEDREPITLDPDELLKNLI